MPVYSYSRINTYFTCPTQFQFRYLERRPSPVAEGVELFLGSRFHETMEFLYGQLPKRIPSVNELMDFFKKHWENHWKAVLHKQKEKNYAEPLRIVQESQSVEDYFQKGQLFVENYYHKYHPFDQDKTEGLELKVAFDLDSQGKYKMQGFLDRLARDPDGTLWIHDYKTSSRKMSAEDARYEDQLALYQMGLQQSPAYGPKEKIKLAWHFVAFENDVVVSERNAKEIEWLKKKYVSKIETIEKAREFPTKTGVLCRWCEYLSVCADGTTWVKDHEKSKVLENQSPPKMAEPQAPDTTRTLSKAPIEVPLASSPVVFSPTPGAVRKNRRHLTTASPDQLSLF